MAGKQRLPEQKATTEWHDEYECCRCGGEAESVQCESCGGDGVNGHDCGEDSCCCLDDSDNVECETCDGKGHWKRCGNSPKWCEEHPRPGREGVKRGEITSYRVEGAY